MDPFAAPISPLAHQGEGTLFAHASELYAWYASWLTSPSTQPQIFEILSKILRIAHLSARGGRFLPKKEEKKAVNRLVQLKEDLYDRKIHHTAMDEVLLKILYLLVESSAKALVIAYATELEYRYLIRPRRKQCPEALEAMRATLAGVVAQLTPSLPEINAHAIAQGLAKILENRTPQKLVNGALQEAIKGWISTSL